jgi:penicillin-binding protein 1A
MHEERKKNNMKRLKNNLPATFRTRIYYSLGIMGVFILFMVIGILYLSKDLPSLEELEQFDPDLVTQIISHDGKVIKELYTTKRELVKSNQIPSHLKKALVVTEDQQFYSHWGMNIFRTGLNVVLLVVTRENHGGASSLTQQLARSLYKRIGFSQTMSRKVRELITAVQIEHTYTKQEILTMYLNTVYFGHGTYGVQSASRKYFGKSVEHISIDEAAILVGMLRSPQTYSPINHPDRAKRVRNVVLNNMYREGVLSAVDRNYYKSLDVVTVNEIGDEDTDFAPHFSEFIRRKLERIDEELDVNLYRDGLKIHTTLDTRLQSIAYSTLMEELEKQQQDFNARMLDTNNSELDSILVNMLFTADSVRLMIRDSIPIAAELRQYLIVQGALIALDVETGQIKAMVGGRNYEESQWNRATQTKRQPGSSFKPFLYTAAIDNNYPVTTTLLNQPVVIRYGDSLEWRPKNYDLSIGGPTTLREAIRRSLNLIAVRIIQELIEPKVVRSYARRLGITSPIAAVDALALGVSAVYPIEMAAAYAVFPRLGIWIEPTSIISIQDRYDSILKVYTPEQKEVLGRGSSYVMLSMLQTVQDHGTGQGARNIYHFRAPAGGKTGTTQGFTDAWYVGFTTRLSVAVWVGMDSPSVSLGQRKSGSAVAVPIWSKFMKASYDSLGWASEDFNIPEEAIEYAEICTESHKRATKYCTSFREVFKLGTIPVDECDIHGVKHEERTIEF